MLSRDIVVLALTYVCVRVVCAMIQNILLDVCICEYAHHICICLCAGVYLCMNMSSTQDVMCTIETYEISKL